MHCRKKVIAACTQKGVVVGDSGGDNLGDAALDDAFNRFGVLELLADSDLESGLDEAGHIGVKCVVRKAREGHVGRGSVRALSEHNVEGFSGGDGVVATGFVEVAHAKQQQRLRVRGLEGVVLGH